MDDKQAPNATDSLVKKLTQFGCVIWFLSLLLPGFVPIGDSVWFGFAILLLGLPFGWLVMGWAVYANIFFFYASKQLIAGKSGGFSVPAMVALAATLPMFVGIVQNEGSMTASPVASWGWGSILWLVSLGFVVCAAAIQAAPQQRKLWLTLLTAAVLLALIPTAIVNGFQWRKANIQEREAYLSFGLAFTVQPLCGIAVNWPQQPFIDANEVVSIDVAPELRDPPQGLPRLWMPTNFLAYQEDGFDWRVYRSPVDAKDWSRIRVRSPSVRHRYVISAQSAPNLGGAVIQLQDREANRVLYEQRLGYVLDNKGWRQFCPFQAYGDRIKIGYDKALLRAVGQHEQRQENFVLKNEVIDGPCEVGPPTKSGNWTNLRRWDGRDIVIGEGDTSIAGLCSDNYAAIIYAWDAPSSTGEHQPGAVVHVFERKTLRPIAVFNNPRPYQAGSSRLPADAIKLIRVQNDSATIATALGEIHATRVAPYTR